MTTNNLTQMIAEQTCLLAVEFSIPSGEKVIKLEDLQRLGIDTSLLPPAHAASLGKKRIFPKEAIAELKRIARSVPYELRKFSTGILGGWMVPREKLQLAVDICRQAADEFEAAKEQFLDAYNTNLVAWIASQPPEWRQAIKDAAEPAMIVGDKILYNYQFLAFSTPAGMTENEGMISQLTSAYGRLCHEVRQMAKKALEESFTGRNEVGQRAIRPIHTIREKLDGMRVLGADVGTYVDTIDSVLNNLPKQGWINGKSLLEVTGLVSRLSNMGYSKPKPEDTDSEEVDEPLLFDDAPASAEAPETVEVTAKTSPFVPRTASSEPVSAKPAPKATPMVVQPFVPSTSSSRRRGTSINW